MTEFLRHVHFNIIIVVIFFFSKHEKNQKYFTISCRVRWCETSHERLSSSPSKNTRWSARVAFFTSWFLKNMIDKL